MVPRRRVPNIEGPREKIPSGLLVQSKRLIMHTNTLAALVLKLNARTWRAADSPWQLGRRFEPSAGAVAVSWRVCHACRNPALLARNVTRLLEEVYCSSAAFHWASSELHTASPTAPLLSQGTKEQHCKPNAGLVCPGFLPDPGCSGLDR